MTILNSDSISVFNRTYIKNLDLELNVLTQKKIVVSSYIFFGVSCCQKSI